MCSICRSRNVKSLYVRESVTDLRLMSPGKKARQTPLSPERYDGVMRNAITHQRFTPFGLVCLKCGFVTITNPSYVFKSRKPPTKPKLKPSPEKIEQLKRNLEAHWIK
ncbi:MAG: hypothetical protein B2I17_08200 [Thermoplasmatales archaeon B_DKE]|nr:MAG: hypothetical protein B2I17_08200 [Thermoplasmatales archaeon B_DKE]